MRHAKLFPTLLVIWALNLLLFIPASFAQQLPPEVAKFGYPEIIFVNGKIVSMDDISNSTNPGRIYQALAVKADKIVKVGSDAEVRALAGPETKVHDLKGRTMLPGIVEPHSHIYGGVTRYLERFGFKFPPNGIIVQAQADRSLEKTQGIIRDALKDAIKKVQPGDWVVLNVRPHAEAPTDLRVWAWTRRLTNKKTLDQWTGDKNPVLLQPSSRGWFNSKAMEVMNDFLPGYSASIQETMHGIDIGEDVPAIGWVGSVEMDVINWEMFLQKLPNNTLAQILKLISEEYGAIGVTTVASRLQFPKIMTGYATLAGLGQMPIRFAAHYEVHRMPTEPSQTRQMYRRTGVLQGIGDDFFWIDGVASERWDSNYPESCLGPDVPAPPNIKAHEVCPKPGDLPWDTLENALKAGWRLAGVHICGSQSARAFFQLLENARAANGWTVQEVHDMHMTGEHCDVIGKQPDIIAGLKKYGIILSCGANYINYAPDFIRDYGPAVEPFIMPFRSWIESGVKVVGQHFGGGAWGRGGEGSAGGVTPPFFQPWMLVTRKYDGKVWQPDERIDRVHALKMFTSWAAEYVQRPDKVGTIETGKYADLLVIDRDYFTIPIDDLLKIRPLMTLVGGKVIALQAALAQDLGVPVVGPQYSFKDEDVTYIGGPISEIAKRNSGGE